MFLRRASVIIAGRTPPSVQVDQITETPNRLDRVRLVQSLLSSKEYADNWGRWLTALTGCDEQQLSPAAFAMKVPRQRLFWLWQKWCQNCIDEDRGCDTIVKQILSSSSRRAGESYTLFNDRQHELILALRTEFDGQLEDDINDLFWKTLRTPEQNAELIARNLMGIRLECAKCHDHPFDNWTTEDHTGMSAIFQRVVHAEQPITRPQKRRIVAGVGAVIMFTQICLVSIAIWSRRRSPFVWVTSLALAGAIVGVGTYSIANYFHLLSGTTDPQSARLAVHLEHFLGISTWTIVCFTTIIAVFLLRRSLASLYIQNGKAVASFSCFMAGTLLMIVACDVGAVASGYLPTGQSGLSMLVKRSLSSLGLGGQGEQIREIYDDTNGNYHRIGRPRLLDGTILPDTADDQPRSLFAEWLVSEPSQHFARNFVNRVAARVFNQSFITPVDDVRSDSSIIDEQFFEETTEGFIAHHYSLKWLLERFLTSKRFQVSTPSTDRVCFQSRSLRAEEILASLNDITPHVSLRLAETWTPEPNDPYSCGSFAPSRSTVADQLIRSYGLNQPGRRLPFHAVVVLMVHPDLRQFTRDLWNTVHREGASTHDSLDHICMSLCSRPLTAEELDFFSVKDENWGHSSVDPVWMIVNCEDFLTLE